MKTYYPPSKPYESFGVSIFLAGSIEQNKADQWQKYVESQLENERGMIFNPRRVNWDTSLKQDINEPVFVEQVNWELYYLEKSDIIFMYFDPKTQSPITLLEFGKYYDSGKLIVCSPEGFWRRGNLQVCCQEAGIKLHDNLDTAIEALKLKISLARI